MPFNISTRIHLAYPPYPLRCQHFCAVSKLLGLCKRRKEKMRRRLFKSLRPSGGIRVAKGLKSWLRSAHIIDTMKNPIRIRHLGKEAFPPSKIVVFPLSNNCVWVSVWPRGEMLKITPFLLTVNFSAWLHDDRAIKFYSLISFVDINSIMLETFGGKRRKNMSKQEGKVERVKG